MAIQLTRELEQIIQDAVDKNASDIFLIPGEPVTFRVSGCVERTDADPLTPADVRAIAAAAVGEEALEEISARTGDLGL